MIDTGKVLVVDDSQTMRRVIGYILKEQIGLDYVEASNGVEALRIAERQPIKLLITDLRMPIMDGINLIKILKNTREYRDLASLIVTTEWKEDIKHKAKEAGASGWINKPIKPEQIIHAIRRLGLESQLACA